MEYKINGVYHTTLVAALRAHTTAQGGQARVAILGPTGCGKTTLVHNAAKELELDIIEVNATSSLKEIEAHLQDVVANKTIEAFFSPTQRLLFIDDLDVLMMSFPKLASSLLAWLQMPGRSLPPVVVALQSQEERRLADLKAHFQLIKMARPSTQACLVHFMKETEGRGIDDGDLLKLIKAHKNDLRAIAVNLGQIDGGTSAGAAGVEIASLRSTFSDLTLFDIQSKLFATPLTKEHLKDLVYTDSKLLGLVLYENVPIEIQKNRVIKGVSTPDMLGQLSRIMDTYIHCDIADTHMNIMSCWDTAPLFNNVLLNTINQVVHQWPRVVSPNTSFGFTPMMTKTALRYQYARHKRAFLQSYGLGDDHFCSAAAIIGRYMGANKPKAPVDLRLKKAAIDSVAKWGVDYELMTAARATSWKKFGRKHRGDDDDAAGSSDEA
jgi:hypothetical protein